MLKSDLSLGFEHVLMVKTSTIKHAKTLKKIYEKLLSKYFLKTIEVLLATSHTGITEEDKNKLKAGKTNIVVCVDMFGEGYDLPNLKILALHKKCKSLPIFMQLIGRFTRTNKAKKIGVATIIANIVADDITEQFQELYEVDADWNLLLGTLNKEKMVKEFFSSSIEGVYSNELIRKLFSSNSFYIKNSAIIYEDIEDNLNDIFTHTNFIKFFTKLSDSYISAIFKEQNLAILLSRKKVTPLWVSSDELSFDSYEIFLFFKNGKDLFIHGTNKESVYGLAKELGFKNYSFPNLYRIFHNLERSAFANLGMLSASRNIKFRMFTGTDVYQELTQQDLNNNGLSNLFGHGFIEGKKASIGCSRKGIVWSMASANIYQWIQWCVSLSNKINDINIPVDSFLTNMLEPFNVVDLKYFSILTVSPVDLIKTKSLSIKNIKAELGLKKINFQFYEVIFKDQLEDSLIFYIKIYFDDDIYCLLEYSYKLDVGFNLLSESMNGIKISNSLELLKKIPESLELVAWTSNFEVISLNDSIGYKTKYEYTLQKEHVTELDWSGVEINKESWKYGEVKNSVQGKVIDILSQKNQPNILFYDDGSNELADLIGFWIDEKNQKVIMRLYHCKYAIGQKTSISATDELIQQTLSTCDKLSDPIKALKHLKTRENNTFRKIKKSRFILGAMADLDALIKKYRTYDVVTEIVLVQPSLDYSELNSRVNSVLGQLACITKQTLHAETYYIIK
jgi:hypothetical protein